MRNSPALNLILFAICGSGWGCIATPSTVAQSASPAFVPTTTALAPRVAAIPTVTPSTASPSPFLPGVKLPAFPGTVPIPSPTSTPSTMPQYPLVKVPTPGLRSERVKNRTNVQPAVNKKRNTPVRLRRMPREQS